MRKRLLFFMLPLLMAAGTAWGKPVDPQKAATVAANFMRTRAGYDSQRWTAQSSPYSQFYVFTTGAEDFVLVAADDNAHPIVGYSTTSSFHTEQMPAHVKSWFAACEDEIRAAARYKQYASVAAEWNNLTAGGQPTLTSATVPPLMSTTWNQAPYYNDLCPADENEYAYYNHKVVTGCVATATSQIMKYHNHPATGYGSHSYTHPTYGTQSADFGSTTYQWSQMPDELTSSSSATEVNAVATLMYHVGVADEMQYDLASNGGSGAYNYNYSGWLMASSQTSLMRYFKYSPLMCAVGRDDMPASEWDDLLRGELDASRPILFSGRSASGGHSFVIDGYDANNMFHVNWGWGGYNDGYFPMGGLQPGTSGIGGNSESAYNQDNVVLLGIEPNNNFGQDGTLTVNTIGNGTVSGDGNYTFGDSVVLLATCGDGYRFAGWGDKSRFNPREMYMNGGDYSLDAIFEPLAGDTLDYCADGHMLTAFGYGSAGNDTYWGIKLPGTVLTAGTAVNKVQFYAYDAGTYDVTIFSGTMSNQKAQKQYYANTTGWHTVILDEPVAVVAGEDLWVRLYTNEVAWPASVTYNCGNTDGFLWGESLDILASNGYTAMIRAIMTDADDPDTPVVTPCTQTCPLFVEMADVYKDGWNDGKLEFYQDDKLISTITLEDGEYGTAQIDACRNGGSILALYTAGSWAYENSFVIYNGDSTVVADVNISNYDYDMSAGDTMTVANFELACPPVDTCEMVITMVDTYGDGWNEGHLHFYQDNTLIATITMEDGKNAETSIPVPDGSDISITFVAGSYTGEVGFTISDAAGNEYLNIPTGTFENVSDSTFVASFTFNCPKCSKPSDLSYSQNGDQYLFTWNNDGEAWQYRLLMNGESTVIDWVNIYNPQVELDDLLAGTNYTFEVRRVCDNDYTPATSISFFTPCDAAVAPYFEEFYTSLGCWSVVDADADNQGWVWENGYARSYSYKDGVGVLTPDNWLVSSPIELMASESQLQFNIRNTSSSSYYYADHYGVYVATTTSGFSADDFTLLYEETMGITNGEWQTRTIDLSAYNGQTVRLAFRHFDCTDQDYIDVDNISVTASNTAHYTISVVSDNTTMGTAYGSGTYAEGDTITIGATANEGYKFLMWDDAETSNPRQVVVNGDATYTATFTAEDEPTPTYYTLTVENPDGGYIYTSINGNGVETLDSITEFTVPEGTEMCLYASTDSPLSLYYQYPNATEVTAIYIDGESVPFDGSDSRVSVYDVMATENYIEYVTCFTMDGDHSYKAEFGPWTGEIDYSPADFMLINDGGGWIQTENSHLTQDTTYLSAGDENKLTLGFATFAPTSPYADDVEESARQLNHLYLDGVEIPLDGSDSRLSYYDHPDEAYIMYVFTVEKTDQQQVIVAEFGPYTDPSLTYYTISVVSDNTTMGTVYGSGTYAEGDTITIGATANEGYKFLMWDDANTSNPRQVVVDGDATYTATFIAEDEPTYYTVTVNNPDNGYVYYSEVGERIHGTSQYTVEQGSMFSIDFGSLNPTKQTVGVAEGAELLDELKLNGESIALDGTDSRITIADNWDNYGYILYTLNINITEDITLDASYKALEMDFDSVDFMIINDGGGWIQKGNTHLTQDTTYLSAESNNGITLYFATFAPTSPYADYVEESARQLNHLYLDGVEIPLDGSDWRLSYTDHAEQAYRWYIFTVEKITQQQVIVAEFGPYTGPNYYTISVVSDNSTMGTVYGSGTYAEGDTITIGATANEGYKFLMWDDANTSNPRQVVVNGDATYTATFTAEDEPTYYTVTVNNPDNGYVYYSELNVRINGTDWYTVEQGSMLSIDFGSINPTKQQNLGVQEGSEMLDELKLNGESIALDGTDSRITITDHWDDYGYILYTLNINITEDITLDATYKIDTADFIVINDGGGWIRRNYHLTKDTTYLSAWGADEIELVFFTFMPTSPYADYVEESARQLNHLYLDGVEIPLDGSDSRLAYGDYVEEGYRWYMFTVEKTDQQQVIVAEFGPWTGDINLDYDFVLINDGGGWIQYSNGYQLTQDTTHLSAGGADEITLNFITCMSTSNYADYVEESARQLNHVYLDGVEIPLDGSDSRLSYSNHADDGYRMYSFTVEKTDQQQVIVAEFGPWTGDINIDYDFVLINDGGGWIQRDNGEHLTQDTTHLSAGGADEITLNFITCMSTSPFAESVEESARQLNHLYLDGVEIPLDGSDSRLSYLNNTYEGYRWYSFTVEKTGQQQVIVAEFGPWTGDNIDDDFMIINDGGGWIQDSDNNPLTQDTTYLSTGDNEIKLFFFTFKPTSPFADLVEESARQLKHLYLDGVEIPLDGSDSRLAYADNEEYDYTAYLFTVEKTYQQQTIVAEFGSYTDTLTYYTLSVDNPDGGYIEYRVNGNYVATLDSGTTELTFTEGTEVCFYASTDSPLSLYYYYPNATEVTAIYIDGESVPFDGSDSRVTVNDFMATDNYILYGTCFTMDSDHSYKAEFGPWTGEIDYTTVDFKVINDGGGWIQTENAHLTLDTTYLSAGNNNEITLGFATFLPTSPFADYVEESARQLNHLYLDSVEIPLDGSDSRLFITDHENDGYIMYTFTVEKTDQQQVIVAEFGPWTDTSLTYYTISVASADGTMGTTYGSGTYAEGDTITIGATANEGYKFLMWNDANTSNPRQVVVAGDANYVAIFEVVEGPTPTYYTISVVSADSTMGSASGSGTYAEGDTITISATANEGYKFLMWNDANTSNPRQVVVNGDATYTATFTAEEEPTYYTISVISADSTMGSVSGSGTYAEGDTITISATANEGYHFKGWNDGNKENPRQVVVTGDAYYVATFEEGTEGIDDVAADWNIQLYPNPAISEAHLTGLPAECTVSIIDQSGRQIATHKVASTELHLDVAHYAAGTYYIRIVAEGAVRTAKLVVSR